MQWIVCDIVYNGKNLGEAMWCPICGKGSDMQEICPHCGNKYNDDDIGGKTDGKNC